MELRVENKFNRLTILSYSHSDKRWRKKGGNRCETQCLGYNVLQPLYIPS